MSNVISDGLSIVFNTDGQEWRDHLKDLVNALKHPPSQIQFDQDDKLGLQIRNKMKIVIVIFSPGHKDLMQNKPDLDYCNIVQDPSKTIMFYCGASKEDLDELDVNKRPILDRFYEFSKWKKFDTDSVDEMILEVQKLLEQKTPPPVKRSAKPPVSSPTLYKVKMTNSKARCEEPTEIVLSFDKEVPKDAKVEIHLTEQDLDVEDDSIIYN
jgi:hypothetical protein